MSSEFTPPPTSPAKAILANRIIWAGLILGQLAFMAVEALILSQPQEGIRNQPATAQQAQLFLIVNAVMLLTIVPGTFIFRLLTFRRARLENQGLLPPAAYATGNIIFWAGCEGCSFFGLVVALLNRNFWPTIIFVILASTLQLLTFPRRSAIEPPFGS